MQHLKLIGVGPVAPRHAQVTENELREECQIEAQIDDQGGELRPTLRIHAAGHLRPPIMQAAQIGHNGTAHHNVMEMCNHEVSIVNVDIHPQARHKQPGESANREQSNESERV